MNEKISVVIPAFNIQEYLAKTLDSVLKQIYKNLEVIVVNDGSQDDTGAVADAYAAKDSRIRVIHKENGGVTSARLQGIAEASGEWIGFVDGDDFVEPDMYEKLLKNAADYSAQISHCGYQMVFPSRVDYYYNTGEKVLQQGTQGCTDLLDGRFVEPGLVNKLYSKELFVGLSEWMDKSIRINEDLLMNFFLFRQAKNAIFEDVCPYHYVLRNGSAATSRLNEHKLCDPLRVLSILLKETADEPQWNAIVQRRLIYQLINTATLSCGEQRELIAPVRRKARTELRQHLGSVLSGNFFSWKMKTMALWAVIWPWSYYMVHKLYARVRGTDKKYVVK